MTASSRGLSDLRYGHAPTGVLGVGPAEPARQADPVNLLRSRELKTLDALPIIVLEETARLIEKKVVRLWVPFRRWAAELDRSANFQVQSYTIEILLESVSLAAIRDPFDRAIVATARQLRCPLITADTLIAVGNLTDTVWN